MSVLLVTLGAHTLITVHMSGLHLSCGTRVNCCTIPAVKQFSTAVSFTNVCAPTSVKL